MINIGYLSIIDVDECDNFNEKYGESRIKNKLNQIGTVIQNFCNNNPNNCMKGFKCNTNDLIQLMMVIVMNKNVMIMIMIYIEIMEKCVFNLKMKPKIALHAIVPEIRHVQFSRLKNRNKIVR